MKFEMPSFQIPVTHTCYKPYDIANIISLHFVYSQRYIYGSCCVHLAACSLVQQFSEVSNSGKHWWFSKYWHPLCVQYKSNYDKNFRMYLFMI